MSELINLFQTGKQFTAVIVNLLVDGLMTKFDKASRKLAINFLLDNFFFNFGNFLVRRIIGIHMDFNRFLATCLVLWMICLL